MEYHSPIGSAILTDLKGQIFDLRNEPFSHGDSYQDEGQRGLIPNVSARGGTMLCLIGLHSAIPDHSDWRNAPSGRGFFVSECRRCGAEMIKFPRAGWVKMRASDVP
jgi:hypothetical protein